MPERDDKTVPFSARKIPTVERLPSAQLPATFQELQERYKLGSEMSFNDAVQIYFAKLYGDENFRKYLSAVYPEESVEGDLYIDDVKAAEMVKDLAQKEQDSFVGQAKLKTIVRALGVIQRRFNSSRRQRREIHEDGDGH